MTSMYTITVRVPGTDATTSLRLDLESTLQSVGEHLHDRVEPGRAVRWEIRCPSGRTAVGSFTVNGIDCNRKHEIAEHIELVRDVLTEEARDEWPQA